eukprot:CAMPEP_0204650722 /NCGR_PEP_ID=MMETSP0718-20130828/12111_1 /ASSEMBLY_ACC=CAM_ASM_000674 /TAXON_ID=230516 /ORGANISM="Chaetoceros curvisetus" /LENGTH=440 /DNA_ID=CAMNT_0051674243 /DNA_START=103 /DNA_END=1425 /DNA_ORIENTATION=-
MAFSETSYYIWNASGNIASCDAQGFLLSFGSSSGILYNCCLCLYYLAVVKKERSDEYIRTKLEPYYHGLSITIALIISFTTLICEAFNPAPNDGICWAFQYNPPHCEGYENGEIPDGYNIPCGRGRAATVLSLIFSFPLLLASPIVIVASMTITYKAVLKHELKMAEYGVGSLRASVARSSILMRNAAEQTEDDNPRSSIIRRFSHRLSSSMSSAFESPRRMSRSRAVLYKGLAYSGAYMFCYMPYFITNIVYIFLDKKKPFPLILSFQICVPLQGLLNFAIFLHPKVAGIRKKGNISLIGAIIRAMKSRGSRSRRTSIRNRNSGRGRISLHNNDRRRRRKRQKTRKRHSFRETIKRRSRQMKRFSKNYSVIIEGQQEDATVNRAQSENNARDLQRIYRELSERNLSSARSSTLSAGSSAQLDEENGAAENDDVGAQPEL